MLFQATGAKYRLIDALRVLFLRGNAQDSEQLRQLLSLRYQGDEVVLCRRGRDALAEAVRLATGNSGRVVISGLTCYSLVQAVRSAGVEAVFADIEKDSLNFSAQMLDKLASQDNQIKAVVIQNMLGIPADIVELEKVTKKHNLILIEDLAHSAGATYADGREVGTVGDLTMLSFGKDKAIDSVNGGALVVRNQRFSGQATQPSHSVSLKDQLRDRLYPVFAWKVRALYRVGLGRYLMGGLIRLGLVVRSADGEIDTDLKLPNWQAKIALAQLAQLDNIVGKRRQKSRLYTSELASFIPEKALSPGASLIRVPLFVKKRDGLFGKLAKKRIYMNDVWYDTPVAPVRYYKKVNYPEKNCPVSVEVAKKLVNLPTHDIVNGEHVRIICQTIREHESENS